MSRGGRLDCYDLVWLGEDDEVVRGVTADPLEANAGCGGDRRPQRRSANATWSCASERWCASAAGGSRAVVRIRREDPPVLVGGWRAA